MTPPIERPKLHLPTDADQLANRATPLKISLKSYLVAFALAGISDIISVYATPIPPVVWILDVVTGVLLFLVLGRQWLLLPGLIMEAIPGVGVIPIWVFVIAAIALWGTARPDVKSIGDEQHEPR